jgi:hypothetical protein
VVTWEVRHSLANVCEADHGFWKDQPFAIAQMNPIGNSDD